jgi:hypothetical protein
VFNDGTPVPEELLAQTFIELKDRLKARFDQLDVWITSHPMDVI